MILLLACAPAPLPKATVPAPDAAPTSGDWLATVTTRQRAEARAFKPTPRPDGAPAAYAAAHARTGLRVEVGSEGAGIGLLDGSAAFGLSVVAIYADDVALPPLAGAPRLGGCVDPAELDTRGACLERVERGEDEAIEWWRSTEGGVEHGFDVYVPADRIEVELGLTGASASPLHDGPGNRGAWIEPDGGPPVRYRGLHAWDADGRPLPARLYAEDDTVRLVVETADAAFPVTVDPLFDQAEWEVGSTSSNTWFGAAVEGVGDVNGDGLGDVVVGESEGVSGGVDTGVVYLYLGTSSGLQTTAAWSMGGDTSVGYFGSSLVALGDVNSDGFDDLAVGAPFEQIGTSLGYAGRVYVLHGGTTGFTLARTLEATQSGEYFGWSVAAGDLNGDGRQDLIVGAAGWTNGENDEGRISVYVATATGIGATAAVSIEGGQVGAMYGGGLAAADVNGDGFDDVVVGSPYYDNGSTDEGALFVHFGASGGIDGTADVVIDEDQASGLLGYSVEAVGDLDGDGFEEISANELQYTGTAAQEGRALVYPGGAAGPGAASWTWASGEAGRGMHPARGLGDVDGDGYDDLAVVTPAGGQVHFGNPVGPSRGRDCLVEEESVWSLRGVGDLGNDGYADVIVSWGDHVGEDEVPMYRGNTTLYAGQTLCGSLAIAGSSSFGRGLAGAGDVNGDGFDDVLIGDPSYTNGQSSEGSARLYLGSAEGLATTAAWVGESNQSGAEYGRAVAGAGDLNCDGFDDVVVGAPLYDGRGAPDAGRVFVYLGSTTGLPASASGTLTSTDAGAEFGHAVAGAGAVKTSGCRCLLVGAPYADHGQATEGTVTVSCATSGSSLSLSTFATLEMNQSGARFGWSVAGPGNMNSTGTKGAEVVVGAPDYDAGQTDEGAVFVWHGGASLAASPNTTLQLDQAGAGMGFAVAKAGDVTGDAFGDLVVGVPDWQAGTMASAGRTLVYRGSSSGVVTTPVLDVTGTSSNGLCGYAVSGGGDWNGDGFADVLTGCQQLDVPTVNQGGAFVYAGGSGTLSSTPIVELYSDGGPATFLGENVAFAGDVDADGQDELLVYAPYWSWGTGEGVVLVR